MNIYINVFKKGEFGPLSPFLQSTQNTKIEKNIKRLSNNWIIFVQLIKILQDIKLTEKKA